MPVVGNRKPTNRIDAIKMRDLTKFIVWLITKKINCVYK